MAKNWWEQEVKYRNTLQEMLYSGIFTRPDQVRRLGVCNTFNSERDRWRGRLICQLQR